MENSQEWRGGLLDVDIQSLNPEFIEGSDNEYWLKFKKESPELDEFSLSSYFIGGEFKFFDNQTQSPGKFKVLKREGYKIRVKILD
jgi:hypothetical protein